MIVNAFTCDRTRVADFGMGFSGSHHEGLLGKNKSWHDNVAHISKTNRMITVDGASVTTRKAFIQFDRLWAGQVAYLAKRLAGHRGRRHDARQHADLRGVESGTDHNHSPRDMQYLLIGGRNMGLKAGQYLKLANTQSAHKLLTSVLNAFGYTADGFRHRSDVGPLAGVL